MTKKKATDKRPDLYANIHKTQERAKHFKVKKVKKAA